MASQRMTANGIVRVRSRRTKPKQRLNTKRRIRQARIRREMASDPALT